PHIYTLSLHDALPISSSSVKILPQPSRPTSEYLPVMKRQRTRSGLTLRMAHTSPVLQRGFAGKPKLFRRGGGSFLLGFSRVISILRLRQDFAVILLYVNMPDMQG